MAASPSIIERAFQLASSGECRSVEEIKKRPERERYDGVLSHLAGSSIKRDLVKANAAARTLATPE